MRISDWSSDVCSSDLLVTHGHPVGDEVLREISNRIVRNIRGIDMACRYGGEEFVVLMPDTDIDSAEVVASRLLHAIGDKPVAVKAAVGELSVTCSIGCTSSSDQDTADTLPLGSAARRERMGH